MVCGLAVSSHRLLENAQPLNVQSLDVQRPQI